MENFYRVLNINRSTFSKEKLETNYAGFIKLLNKSYEQHKNDEQALLKLDEMKANFEKAYGVLSDDEKRSEYDKKLDEEKQKKEDSIQRERRNEEERVKQEKEKQEKYSCFKMYDSSLIKSVSYRRNTAGEIFFMPYTFEEEKSTRKVNCRLLGFISYRTDFKEVKNKLARYEVKSISTQNPETKKYVVITPVINYDELCDNPEYKKAVYEKLFSEKNLEKSKHENYEYLGKIVNNGNKYSIDYDKEEFCASVRFGTKLKRRVDHPNKRKKGVIGKFKRLVKRIVEKSKQDDDYER